MRGIGAPAAGSPQDRVGEPGRGGPEGARRPSGDQPGGGEGRACQRPRTGDQPARDRSAAWSNMRELVDPSRESTVMLDLPAAYYDDDRRASTTARWSRRDLREPLSALTHDRRVGSAEDQCGQVLDRCPRRQVHDHAVAVAAVPLECAERHGVAVFPLQWPPKAGITSGAIRESAARAVGERPASLRPGTKEANKTTGDSI